MGGVIWLIRGLRDRILGRGKVTRGYNFGSERGFTIVEVSVSLLVCSIIFSMLMGIFVIASDKTVYLDGDSQVLRFEKSLSTWVSVDYRENRVVSMDSSRFSEGRLTFIIEEDDGKRKEITYANRKNGYYRLEGTKPLKLSSRFIRRINLEKNILEFTYDLNESTKTLRVKLVK